MSETGRRRRQIQSKGDAMKQKHSKAWYAKNAKIEGDSEVGAGVPPSVTCPKCGGRTQAMLSLSNTIKIHCKRCAGTVDKPDKRFLPTP
jgi:formylmethanofuran dehydrogenase subunit E